MLGKKAPNDFDLQKKDFCVKLNLWDGCSQWKNVIANYYQKHGNLVLVYSLISCSHSFVDGFHNKVVGSNVACRGCQTKKSVFRMITERHSICIILHFSCPAETNGIS